MWQWPVTGAPRTFPRPADNHPVSTALAPDGKTLAVGTTTTSFSVYGRIPVAQDRPAGAYTDTIVVTLNY